MERLIELCRPPVLEQSADVSRAIEQGRPVQANALRGMAAAMCCNAVEACSGWFLATLDQAALEPVVRQARLWHEFARIQSAKDVAGAEATPADVPAEVRRDMDTTLRYVAARYAIGELVALSVTHGSAVHRAVAAKCPPQSAARAVHEAHAQILRLVESQS